MPVVLDAVVVGAGFAGIGMAIRLRQAGKRFVVLERSDRIGGTWRDNHYPGCACDVPAHLYSYSFEPNPAWTLPFAPQAEILAYLERCVDKYGVREHVRMRSPATHASFDESVGEWEVTTPAEKVRARALVLGVGPLNRPSRPRIRGLGRFRGPLFHSAEWDTSVALARKRVAVVGTGASAIQIVPAIAPVVARLFVYQRTPAWILPKANDPISEEARARFARHPAMQRAMRQGIYALNEFWGLGFAHARPLMKLGAWLARTYRERTVSDPALREKLTPDYEMGCKRILLSSDFYPAMQRPHVELVTDGIREVTEEGIVTEDGQERRVDVIVLATGFHAADIHAPFPIEGLDGRVFRDGAEAYLGTTFSGFPNLFMIIGPNTGLGHTSMIVMMEAQIGYIMAALDTLARRNLRWVDVRADSQDTFNDRIQKRLSKTVWNAGGCTSWYTTKDGKNTTLWPGLTLEYRARMRRFDLESYATAPSAGRAREARGEALVARG